MKSSLKIFDLFFDTFWLFQLFFVQWSLYILYSLYDMYRRKLITMVINLYGIFEFWQVRYEAKTISRSSRGQWQC